MGAVATWFDQTFVQPIRFFFSGVYNGTEGNDVIVAANIFGNWSGGEAKIYAGGGNDDIYLAAVATTVYTGTGNDRIFGVAASMTVRDDWGNLEVYGAGGAFNVYKNGDGWIYIGAAAAYANIDSRGNGDVTFSGLAGYANITKYGYGNVNFHGAAGGARVYQSGGGDINFYGAAGSNDIDKYGDGNIRFYGVAGSADLFQRGSGNVLFNGAAGYAKVYKEGNGQLDFNGAAGGVNVYQGGNGDVNFRGAAGSVNINKQGSGNISFFGAAGGTSLTQNGSGNIYFAGAGGAVNINKTGNGQIELYGAAAHTNISQNGAGNITFGGAGANVQINKIATTGNVVLQGGVGNVNVNYSQGNGSIIFQGAAGNINLSHATGDIVIYGALGAAIVNKGGDGNIDFKGVAGYIDLNHTGNSGTVNINGAAAYSKVVRRSNNNNIRNNNIYFYGAGAYSNVLQQASGNIDFRGAGAANVLTHTGVYGNTAFAGAGVANIINHSAQGDVSFNGAGAANVITHKGATGNTSFNGAGGANVITHSAQGNVDFNGVGIANVILHTGSTGNAYINAGGALNLVVRQGSGNLNLTMVALGNIAVHLGNGTDRIFQLGGLNTYTRVGDGDTVLGLAGGLNVATLIGNGSVYGALLGAGNVVTKVGTGDTYLATVGAGNVISHIDSSNSSSQTAALLVGGANILTKYGQGDLYGLMAGGFNVATHVGTGNDYMAQLGGGNILTKVGQGNLMAAQFGIGNILTHVGNGMSLGLMAGGGNAYTKVGNGLSASLMLGTTANVYTHVGSGDSFAIMASQGGNLFTKVDVNSTAQSTDITAAAMLGSGNVFTHVGSGTTGALMLAGGNLFTKVGDGNTAAAMIGVGNIATHVGNGSLIAVMGGVPAGVPSGNVLTKVGNGTTVGVMAASGNIFTHVGDGNTTGVALGQGNIITKVGTGDQVNAVLGQANILTHVTLNNGTNSEKTASNNSYNLAIGKGNIVTKVGDGKQVSALVGDGNVVTHVGDGDAINLAIGGKANIVTKVGDGNTVTGLLNGQANIITHMGDGNDYQGVWGKANIVTKVGDGTSASAMKGSANIITAVGDGAQVGILLGDLNVITKVGDGVSVNFIKGQGNINTKVGDGASVAVMMGMGNANIQVGDGTSAFVAYANNNISIKIGDGDYYGFAFAKGKATALQNAQALGRNILQSAAGFVGSGVISQLIWGAEETGHASSQDTQTDVSETVLAEPAIVEPNFDFSKFATKPSFKSNNTDVQVAEPSANSNLNRDNIEQIDSNQQAQQSEASRAGANAAELAIKKGIDNARSDVNGVFNVLESAVGEGGALQSILDTASTALVNQLSVLDSYVGELDESLKTKQSSKQNGEFANGIISNVNTQLTSTLQTADDALSQSDDAVGDAKLQIEKVKQDAQLRQTVAADAQGDAFTVQQAANQQKLTAESRVTGSQGQAASQQGLAQTRVNGVNSNAAGAKLSDADKPNRTAANGSGLTGNVTALDGIDGFNTKSDAQLATTATNIVNQSQQAVLQSGFTGIAITPQVLGQGVPSLPQEEENEGGLTDEQIAALHAAESLNNMLGLKGSWRTSVEVKQWADSDTINVKKTLRSPLTDALAQVTAATGVSFNGTSRRNPLTQGQIDALLIQTMDRVLVTFEAQRLQPTLTEDQKTVFAQEASVIAYKILGAYLANHQSTNDALLELQKLTKSFAQKSLQIDLEQTFSSKAFLHRVYDQTDLISTLKSGGITSAATYFNDVSTAVTGLITQLDTDIRATAGLNKLAAETARYDILRLHYELTQGSPFNFGSGGGGGKIDKNQLSRDFIFQPPIDQLLKDQLNFFINKADRGESEKLVSEAFNNVDIDTIIDNATTARGIDSPLSKSKNHILADSMIRVILASAVNEIANDLTLVDANHIANTQADMSRFIDALVGTMDQRFFVGGAAPQGLVELSDYAKQAFGNAILAVQNNNYGQVSVELEKIYNAVSYAPGNIRYGESHVNGMKKNFFDAPMVLRANAGGQLELSYDQSATDIFDTVTQLANAGIVNRQIVDHALMADYSGKTAGAGGDVPHVYSSNGIRLILPNGQQGELVDANGRFLYSSDLSLAVGVRVNGAVIPLAPIAVNNYGGRLADSTTITTNLLNPLLNPQLLTINGEPKYASTGKVVIANIELGDKTASIRAPTVIDDTESSGIGKDNKRPDYMVTAEMTTEDGDKITVYRIRSLDGGSDQFRVQVDLEGDAKQRFSIFSSKNPIQADGSLKLPDVNTVIAHGVTEGNSYFSVMDVDNIAEKGKFVAASGHDFSHADDLVVAEHNAANTQRDEVILTKFRGVDEGIDLDMQKNQEQVILASLKQRATNGDQAMGYIAIGGHDVSVKNSALERFMSSVGTSRLINGYCRAPVGAVPNAENITRTVFTTETQLVNDADKLQFNHALKSEIKARSIVRQVDLEGRRTAAAEATLRKAGVIGSKIERHSAYMKLKLAVPTMNYKSPINTNGNIQVQVGDGEYIAGFWGNTNIGVKVGDGGFKTITFGNNNVMVHIGDGDNAKHTVKVADYTAFESVQVFIGERNISYNQGRSNDFIVMMDKSIPLAPFQSPLNGPSDIVGFLKNDIAHFNVNQGNIDPLTGDPVEDNYYDSQSFLWTNNNAKKIIDQISALDMNSAVEYTTLFDYGSENDRSDRALKADLERKANAMLNQAIAGQSPLSMAKNRNVKDQNFNITIAGQGSDILIANGDNQFMFGDNAQSIMDTTVASLFGILSQDVGRNGQVSNPLSVSGGSNAKEAFLNTLKNLAQDTFSRVMARTAAGLPDMSFGEAFGMDYKADGELIVENTIGDSGMPSAQELVDYAQSGMQGMMGVLGSFGNTNLGAYLDSSRLVDTLKTALDQGPEAVAAFRDSLLGTTVTEEPNSEENVDTEISADNPDQTSGTTQSEGDVPTQPSVPTMKSSEVFGFGALKLPSIFDFDISAGFSAIPDMVNNLVGTLDSFDGDIETMKTQMFDFFSKSGYMQGDGDLMLSLGNNNFAWGGDGADIAAFMGLNNNFWGGRGNDMYYGIGENNQASGNDGDDTAILLGINNIFFGGDGNDFALASGRNGNLAGGDGDDTLYVLGDTSWLNGGTGNDYLVAVGNYNGIDGGDGNDFAVSIGNFADVDLGAGHDVVSIFGNASSIKTGAGDDLLRLMGHKSQLYAGEGNDFIWAESEARDNIIEGNTGDDTFVLGGSGNVFYGGEGLDTFIINDSIINVRVADIHYGDQLIFSAMAFDHIWFSRSDSDLMVYLDNELGSVVTLDNYFDPEERADIVVGTLANTEGDQPQYEVLSTDALNQLIQVMASYDVVGDEDGFMSSVSSQDQQLIASAWDKTIVKGGSTFTAFV